MTYRYCQMACGRPIPKRSSGIDWIGLLMAVPCDKDWKEIEVPSKSDDMRLWNKQVLDYRVEGNVMYCRLEM